MDKKEIKMWDNHLCQQRKELGIETYRGVQRDIGIIKLFNDDIGKCIVCEAPTKSIQFLNKRGNGTVISVCKKCLKKATEVL